MIYFIEDSINGIMMGSIYGLTALGLTIIFGVLKVVNFAHGSLLMVGMYVAYWAVSLTGLHPYLALVIVAPVMFLFGYFIQDIVIKPIFKAEKDVREPLDGHHRHHRHLVRSGQPHPAGFRTPVPVHPGQPAQGEDDGGCRRFHFRA